MKLLIKMTLSLYTFFPLFGHAVVKMLRFKSPNQYFFFNPAFILMLLV